MQLGRGPDDGRCPKAYDAHADDDDNDGGSGGDSSQRTTMLTRMTIAPSPTTSTGTAVWDDGCPLADNEDDDDDDWDDKEKVFDLDKWEAAHCAKRTDAMDRQQKKRNRSKGTYFKPSTHSPKTATTKTTKTTTGKTGAPVPTTSTTKTNGAAMNGATGTMGAPMPRTSIATDTDAPSSCRRALSLPSSRQSRLTNEPSSTATHNGGRIDHHLTLWANEAPHEGHNKGRHNKGPDKGTNEGANKAANKGPNEGANEGANNAANKVPAEITVHVKVQGQRKYSVKAIIPPANECKKFSDKIVKFIQINNLNLEVKEVFDYLFNYPSHHPLVAGPGINLTVDFSENICTKKKTTKKGNCFRSTYATRIGTLMAGTPNRYVVFVQMCHTCFLYSQKCVF